VKIAIVGTRGIPNRYGGFEQNAENLALHFHAAGHEVTVYNPSDHPYREPAWRGVKIRRRFWYERRLGGLGIFLYDYLCLMAAFRDGSDIVLELGYAPASLYHFLRPARRPKIVTNMDGVEWRRAKWGPLARWLLRYCERLAAQTSDAIIADNPGVQDYLERRHHRRAHFVAYGAPVLDAPDVEVCATYGVRPLEYYMVLARLEPENNIETILDGALAGGDLRTVLVVGDCRSRYGRRLTSRYQHASSVRFLGAVYEQAALGSLRRFARLYFHGHSVGGTNPSLLEAMGSGAYIAAHDNPFNRSVLGQDGRYFTTVADVATLIRADDGRDRDRFAAANREKLVHTYNWELVGRSYLRIFEQVLADSA
jgi:glycosyltransferase involved in cell wall biosynthesis